MVTPTVQPTNRPTDQPTDRLTNRQGKYSAICLIEGWKIEGRDLLFGDSNLNRDQQLEGGGEPPQQIIELFNHLKGGGMGKN